MSLRFAYNTNGCASHRLDDALELMAAAGYDGVALTLDHHHLDPFAPDLAARTTALRRRLDALGLGCVIETGARFLLDPRQKHEPTLVSPDAAGRARRLDFLRRAVAVGETLEAEAVSFWAGVPAPADHPAVVAGWLEDGVRAVAKAAERSGVVPALEPEPGMAVGTVAGWRALRERADVPGLRLALDVGHCLVTGDVDPADAVRAHAADLGSVTVEDMRRGVHEHLPFGEGDVDVPGVLAALEAVAWSGLVCVELSRDSHRADVMVPRARAALAAAEREGPHAGAGRPDAAVEVAVR